MAIVQESESFWQSLMQLRIAKRISNLISKHATLICLLTFAIVSGVVLTWFRAERMLGWGDSGLEQAFYNPAYLIKQFSSVWDTTGLAGQHQSNNIASLPVAYLFRGFQLLGVAPWLRQAIWYWIIQYVSIASTFILLLRLIPRNPRHIGAFTGALFWGFNPLLMVNQWYVGNLSIAIVALLPLSLLTIDIVMYERSRVGALRGAILVGLVLSTGSICFENLAYVVPVMLASVIFAVMRYVQGVRSRQLQHPVRIVRDLSVASVLGIGLNGWWIVPTLKGIPSYYNAAVKVENPLQLLDSAAKTTSIVTIAQGIIYKLGDPWWAYKDPPWSATYGQWYMWLIAAIILTVALSAVLLPRIARPALVGTLFVMFGLALSLGLNSPVGGLFRWAFINVPYFGAFRSPANKFIPIYAFGIAILIASSIAYFVDWAASLYRPKLRLLGKLAVALMLVLIGLYSFPMWSGSVVNSPVTIRDNAVSASLQVPGAYREIRDVLERQTGAFQVLTLPLSVGDAVTLDWKYGYDGPNLMWLLLSHSSLSYLEPGNNTSDVLSRIAKLPAPLLIRYSAAIFGVKYVVVDGDVRPQKAGGLSSVPEVSAIELNRAIESSKLSVVRRIMSSGVLSLYEVNPRWQASMINVANHFVGTESEGSTLSKILSTSVMSSVVGNVTTMEPSLVKSLRGMVSVSKTQESNLGGVRESVTSKERSPTRWIGSVVNPAGRGLVLVLDQSYDVGWKLLVGGRGGVWKPIVSSDHFRANGYANAWFIRPNDVRNIRKLRFEMVYGPQSDLGIGLETSLFAGLIVVALSIGYGALNGIWFRRRYRHARRSIVRFMWVGRGSRSDSGVTSIEQSQNG